MSLLRSGQRKKRKNNLFDDIQILQPILIVEDQYSLANMLSELLIERWQCEVHIAETYQEAKQYLSRHRHEYLVTICDLHLPDAPDAEIIDLVKKAKVPMIALSGSFGENIRDEMLDKGVMDYIIKDSFDAYDYLVKQVGRIYKNQHTKILLVDDTNSARDMLKHMLDIQKFQILTAENGVQALQQLDTHPDIRLMVTDYSMPEMDGFTLTLEARKNFPPEQLSIIGVSATNHSELGAQFIKNGANDFMLKPFSYEELLCRINQNIDMLEYMERIRNIANCDYLTKLYNRRFFFLEGQAIYQEAREEKRLLSICMMDIDHFKQVNDTYGHDGGDDVLIHFAQLLTQHFSNHLTARLGGEEFVVLFENSDQQKILQELENFRQVIADKPIASGSDSIAITVSMGLNSQLASNFDDMLKIADQNLYQAKENGRNQVIA